MLVRLVPMPYAQSITNTSFDSEGEFQAKNYFGALDEIHTVHMSHQYFKGGRLSNHVANLGSVAGAAPLVGVYRAYMCIVLISIRPPGIRLWHQFRSRGDNSESDSLNAFSANSGVLLLGFIGPGKITGICAMLVRDGPQSPIYRRSNQHILSVDKRLLEPL